MIWDSPFTSGPIEAVFCMHTADVRLLESSLHSILAFWVNGGLTCLELSSAYLSTSITPISKKDKRTKNVALFHIIQEHSIICALWDHYFNILKSMQLIEGWNGSEVGKLHIFILNYFSVEIPVVIPGLPVAFSSLKTVIPTPTFKSYWYTLSLVFSFKKK